MFLASKIYSIVFFQSTYFKSQSKQQEKYNIATIYLCVKFIKVETVKFELQVVNNYKSMLPTNSLTMMTAL